MGHVDHLNCMGSPRPHAIFFVIFNVAFIFYLSRQGALFFVGSLIKTLPLFTMSPGAKHKIEQIYLWNPMTTGY